MTDYKRVEYDNTPVLVARADTQDSSALAQQATKLATARSIKTDLGSASQASFDGSADVTPGVSGVLPVANGGTGNQNGVAQLLTSANFTRLGNIINVQNGVNTLTAFSLTLTPGIYIYSIYQMTWTAAQNNDTFIVIGFDINGSQNWFQNTQAVPGDTTRSNLCYVIYIDQTATVTPIYYRNGTGTEQQYFEYQTIRIQ